MTTDKITDCIQQRCIDYNTNSTKMINSILKRHKKRIIIDRLFVSENGINKIVLDANDIKNRVNNYFQNVAVPNSLLPPLHEKWNEQYKPISSIDDN